MADTPPSPNEPTAVVTGNQLCRLRTLTFASLALNALILLLLVTGAIIHHHREQRGFAGRGGGRCDGQCQMDYGPRFHHFGRMGMNRGWGRPDGIRGERDGGPPSGMPGMGGMMGGSPKGQPDPVKMTDRILNRLSTQLSLTDDEKNKIKPIVEQQVAEIQKQMEAQRIALQKQIEDAKAKIKPLLTADQQKALDAMPLPGQKPPAPDEVQKTGP